MTDSVDVLQEFLDRDGWTPFYGVDNTLFKLGDRVFEAVEDESDGYRSYLQSVEARPDAKGIFAPAPFAEVRVRETDRGSFDGYELYDRSGHVWLTIGTNNSDDYYPSFVFTYEPSGELVK